MYKRQNIEVIRSPEGSVRLAPLFDSGLSFVFSCYGDEERVRAFDPLSLSLIHI